MDTYVINDKKRREVADFIRKIAQKNFEFDKYNITAAIDIDWEYTSDNKCWNRLADLIDPDPLSVDDVFWWAFANMEGCDEPEFTMFNDIEAAINRYYKEIKEKQDRLKEKEKWTTGRTSMTEDRMNTAR